MNPFIKQGVGAQTQAVEFDAGLRAYMLQVYNYMASALVLTGLVSYVAGTSEAFLKLMFTVNDQGGMSVSPLAWIIMFAPLGMVFFLGARLHTLSKTAAQASFWIFSVLMGLSLFYVFAIYTGESIARVFFITAGTFGAMSLYGYSTKKDLTGWGSFLMMGVLGIFIASIVNIFLHSSGLQFAISVIGVLLFTGLTAYDTQRIKSTYYAMGAAGNAAIMGALNLYLDFINLFIMLLRLFGDRR
ncbi:MAG: Bax inhibitor-1/YccA family protein [Rickettsiales bacterium]